MGDVSFLVAWRLNNFTIWWDDRGVANKPAPALPLRDGDQAILEKVARSSATTAGAAGEDRVAGLPGSRECVDL